MSYTEIYTVNKKGDVEFHAEVKNSFRGAFHVWDTMAKAHLGRPALGNLQPVWDLWKDRRIPESHRIVMAATFDNVIIKRMNLKRLIRALLAFAACDLEGSGSQREQALILEELAGDNNVIAVCWNQTSVNSGVWEIYEGGDESRPYNIHKDKDHWFLFKEFDKLANA